MADPASESAIKEQDEASLAHSKIKQAQSISYTLYETLKGGYDESP